MRRWHHLAVRGGLWMMACAAASGASGQTAPGRLEVGATLQVEGPIRYPELAAQGVTPSGTTRPFFVASSTLLASYAFGARVTAPISRVVAVEAALRIGRPALRTVLSGDAEAARAEARVSLRHYALEGGVVVQKVAWTQTRWQPFVPMGGAWARQLSDNRTQVNDGAQLYGGFGVGRPLSTRRTRERIQSLRLRFEGRLVGVSPALMVDDRWHLRVEGGASLSVRF